MTRDRLLVFNCHEAWVSQLDGIDLDLHIIVGLRGRYTQSWDIRMRPIPSGARLVTLDEVLRSQQSYYCIVAHSITDLLDIKAIDAPKLLVLHTTLDGRAIEERSSIAPAEMSRLLPRFLELVRGHAVAVSELKRRSWGIDADVVVAGVDPDSYLPYQGILARGLRISNQFNKRRQILLANLHDQAFSELPVTFVGHNPEMPGVKAATSFQDLKQTLSQHRFYIHTAHPQYEDGFNMATLEAMAAGLPVIGNSHPTSPIKHGQSGFLSDDPQELRRYAERLLDDQDLARRMGAAARETVRQNFHLQRFRDCFRQSLTNAHRRFHGARKEQVA